jgi:hypothetical protein
MPFERVARFNRAKNIQETKPLETDMARVTSLKKKNKEKTGSLESIEKKKKVEFAALVDYDRLPGPPTADEPSGLKIFKNVSITKWWSKKTSSTSKWIKKYINFGQVILSIKKHRASWIY